MGNFTIPNRPLPGDQRDINLVLADFDAITGDMDSMASKRQLLAQACLYVQNGLSGPAIAGVAGQTLVSGQATSVVPVMWAADYGLTDGTSAQPTDFQISNKLAKCRLRVCVAVDAAGAFTGTFGMTQITAVGGASTNITYTFATPGVVATSAFSFSNGSISALETDEASLPVTSGAVYGFYTTGNPTSGAYSACIQLYGYNT